MKSTQQTLRNQLRQQIRKTRANLTALQQQQAEDSITQQALALIEARNAQLLPCMFPLMVKFPRINLSKPFGHKINTFIYRYCILSIPTTFCSYVICQIHQCWKINLAFGSQKLNVQNVLPLDELDILFTPLVAFDKQGFYNAVNNQKVIPQQVHSST